MTKRTEMLIYFSEMSFVQKEHSILLSVNESTNKVINNIK